MESFRFCLEIPISLWILEFQWWEKQFFEKHNFPKFLANFSLKISFAAKVSSRYLKNFLVPKLTAIGILVLCYGHKNEFDSLLFIEHEITTCSRLPSTHLIRKSWINFGFTEMCRFCSGMIDTGEWGSLSHLWRGSGHNGEACRRRKMSRIGSQCVSCGSDIKKKCS